MAGMLERAKERRRSRAERRDAGDRMCDVFDWIELILLVIGGLVAGLFGGIASLLGCNS